MAFCDDGEAVSRVCKKHASSRTHASARIHTKGYRCLHTIAQDGMDQRIKSARRTFVYAHTRLQDHTHARTCARMQAHKRTHARACVRKVKRTNACIQTLEMAQMEGSLPQRKLVPVRALSTCTHAQAHRCTHVPSKSCRGGWTLCKTRTFVRFLAYCHWHTRVCK